MAVVRTVARGRRTYHYLVQTYRWGGAVHRRERYLGTELPVDLAHQREALEREVWGFTWFRTFDAIRQGYASHRRSLPAAAAATEREQFILEFTYDTNRIEGSTLTFREVADLLIDGVSPARRPMADVREAQLHAMLVKRLLSHPEPVDLPHLLAWHRAMFGETKPPIAGRIRDYEVRIVGSRFVPPSAREVRPTLVELVRRARRRTNALHPVERAAAFHCELEHLHPFGDGNGRVGRLAMNMLLQESGFPMLNIRYGKRGGYYQALERRDLARTPRPFLAWFFRRYARDHARWAPGPARRGGD